MSNPENSHGRRGSEDRTGELLNGDKYINSLISKVNGLKISSPNYVEFVSRDVSTVAGIFDRLDKNPDYEPSTEELENNPRLKEVWESSKDMRDAITDSQTSDETRAAYKSAVDGLVVRVAIAMMSKGMSSNAGGPEAHQTQPASAVEPLPGDGPNGQPASAVEPLPGDGPNGQPASAVEPLPGDGPNGQPASAVEPLPGDGPNGQPASAVEPLPGDGPNGQPASAVEPLPGDGPNGQPASAVEPLPGDGTPGGPGRPGTPPPDSPIPPSSPEGRPGRPAPQTPDHDAGRPETKEQRRKRLEKELAELNEELDAPYAAKLNAYAELLAKEESKRADGGFRFSIMHWVGGRGENRKRERRREALDEAGKALKKEVLAYLRQKVKTKRQNGEYQGTDDEIAQQMSDEMFDEQRKIFGQRLQERKDEILRSESDKLRNRILAKIGSWIGMEKSTKNSLKAAAVGVGHGLVKGAAVGALTGLFGVTWPISVGVSIVAAAVGDRMIRRGIRLDAIRRGLGGQNGSRQLVDDDKFARIKEKAEGKKHSQEFMADKMLKLSRKDSYAAGDKLSRETNERLNKHKVALGIGRLAGGAVGGIGGRWVGQQLHDHTPVGQAVDSAKRNVHEFIHREDTAAAAAEREYQGKIDELNRRIDELNNRLERAAAGNIDNSGSFSNWEYPWDWAVDQFGENNAISKLYELADAAARDGHNIQWHGYGDTQWLSIDGKSDTQSVLEILNKYNYGLAA